MAKLRIFLFVFFIVAVAVLIVFPYRNKAAVNIAFLGRLSGNGSHNDIAACKGAILAVESVNTRGGIEGRQLRLNIYDYKGKPDQIRKICRQMKEKNSDLLLAPYPPEDRLAGCMEKEGILPVSFGFSDPTGEDGLAFYPRAGRSGAALAELALVREIRSMAVLYDAATYPYGLAFLEGFRHLYLERGGRVAEELAFDSSGSVDLKRLAESVEMAALQGILIVASAKATGDIGIGVRERRPSVQLFAAPWVFTEDGDDSPWAASDSKEITGLTGLCTYAEGDSGRSSQVLGPFYSAYTDRYGSPPDPSAIFGYEAVLILAEGIRNSASPDPFLVRHALKKMFRFKGMVSDYTVGKKEAGAEGLVLLEIRDGKIIRGQ